MNAAEILPVTLIDRLPAVRGRITAETLLSGITWFRVGGPAEVMFRPADTEDLAQFLRHCPPEIAVTPVGVGSNLLVRDGGVRGVVVRLGRAHADIEIRGHEIHVGGATLDVNVALTCQQAGIAGLEFLRGVPGTIGGAVRMNAGAYGREIKDVLREAEVVDRAGNRLILTAAELGLSYRHSELPPDSLVTRAVLVGEPGDRAAIAGKIAEITQAREATQPVRSRTGGSTFANPTDPQAKGRKAWELIDAAGCRGLAIGGARISELHCNFLINEGTATASDIEALGEEVRRRVREMSGVELEWEIRRIGLPGGRM
ncbi:UDP-N-acetylmuramate dehydrogenase [Desertibaculum subflavum]|uniref:UDP-N-acetylmuramate dehydrogenase n=1 Tax=Desertibaculum subflavum TaxID=2268458 RepID=UPI000E66EAAF